MNRKKYIFITHTLNLVPLHVEVPSVLEFLRHFGLTINASRPRGACARVENRGSGISRMRSIADRPLNYRRLSMSDMWVFLAIILLEIAPLCS